MVAHIKQKKRGLITRKQKKLILLGTEGKNETESNYFREFNRKQNTYVIKDAKGNNTDPEGIVADTINSLKQEGIDYVEGDLAFCVFDADTNPAKQRQISRAVQLANKHGIEVLLSAPCFEIWFLQHFDYSTAQLTSEAAIEKLSRYIPDYKKNSNVFYQLEPLTNDAIRNAKRLEKYHNEISKYQKGVERNPSTDVYKLVEILKKEMK